MTDLTPLRTLIVDDQALLRRGLKLLLDTEPGVSVVAEAAHGAEALAVLHQARQAGELPDIVLTDARMPTMDGVELVQRCRTEFPGLPVIVLTTFDDEGVVLGALDAGAAGFMLKDCSPEELSAAMTSAMSGRMVVDPRVTHVLVQARRKPDAPELDLTPTQRTVATHLARGATNGEIARAMVLAEGTVKNHVSAILRRTGHTDRTALALFLREHLPTAQ